MHTEHLCHDAQDVDLKKLILPAALLETVRLHGQCDTPTGSPVFSFNPTRTSGVCSFEYSKEAENTLFKFGAKPLASIIYKKQYKSKLMQRIRKRKALVNRGWTSRHRKPCAAGSACDVTVATAVTHTVGHCTEDARGSTEEKKARGVKDKLNRLLLRIQPDGTLGGGTKFFKHHQAGRRIGTTGDGRLQFAAMSFDSRAVKFVHQVCP